MDGVVEEVGDIGGETFGDEVACGESLETCLQIRLRPVAEHDIAIQFDER